ncbi:hypothetical protein BY458DRAFT_127760 [Sporodiniella umbellata]|nr:hypothetical protein BY458DRAFT_127760 [Sporodiniella umbellata]
MLFEKENRLKNNREEILKEMIVAIHPAFSSQKVGKLLESVLQSKMAEVTELLDTEQYAISWRRKCTAEWNTDSQSFIPLQKTEIIEEPFVLVYMHVEELIDRIQNNTVYRHIEKIQNAKKKYQVLLLVEGVEAYYKKRALLQKRLFENEVRKTINDPASATPKTSKKKKQVVSVDDLPSQESVEEYLNELQFMHDIMLVPTKSDDDTVSWIESLTTDLALGRYK